MDEVVPMQVAQGIGQLNAERQNLSHREAVNGSEIGRESSRRVHFQRARFTRGERFSRAACLVPRSKCPDRIGQLHDVIKTARAIIPAHVQDLNHARMQA
jgi:hypothetical protein